MALGVYPRVRPIDQMRVRYYGAGRDQRWLGREHDDADTLSRMTTNRLETFADGVLRRLLDPACAGPGQRGEGVTLTT